MTPGADTIPVEQVDRELAVDIYTDDPYAPTREQYYRELLAGAHDGDELVRQLARHRLRARTEADRSVREALERIANNPLYDNLDKVDLEEFAKAALTGRNPRCGWGEG